ncbi:Aldehyde Dehydrogenase [Methanosalsum zhilinae DSM 4017]|uniref:Aldehyde Dehydrogenase n=1 Tax=Methanosalsum zhilinae (strain DSM 4017 / NBRC 107636 / OCM 62 / WeN5) TaxID=679901 RepID=F7XKU7_METZD|nr:NAD-dependent succinate-semialdehyde dehydrogenase [Methanosalsum zhilinae]AEH61814.1 Aldehyde Dehydrogenase [Methanosalsum zhilinae DSM 4017]
MATIASINPATEEIYKEFEMFSTDHTSRCIEKATCAFKEWRNTDIVLRSEHLSNTARVLRKGKNELASVITEEMGKPIKQSVREIEKCASTFEYFANEAENLLQPIEHGAGAKKSYIRPEPLGPLLCIKPWNFPFWQVLSFASYALMSANVVLLKHSSYVPMCAQKIEDVFLDAGVPEGVFQTLMIDGKCASSLIGRDEIRGVSFTGSTLTGEKVAEKAGRHMKKAVLELGGSDPFIVLEGSDIEMAASTAASARFLNCGQVCISAKRIIVQESIADDFIPLFAEHTEKMKIGDPMDSSTDIGPLASKQQVETLDVQVNDALDHGANVVLEGGKMDGDGYFYSPVILTDITRDMKVYREETFGPVAPIITVNDESEAIQTANDSDFGLGATLWCSDDEKAMKLAGEIESGMVGINGFFRPEPSMPFGGTKKSGIGRELSSFGMYEFMNLKSVKLY